MRYLEQAGEAILQQTQAALSGQRKASAVKSVFYDIRDAGIICRTNPGESGAGVEAVYKLAKDGSVGAGVGI